MKNLAIWREFIGVALASLLLCATAHAQDASAGGGASAAEPAAEAPAAATADAPAQAAEAVKPAPAAAESAPASPAPAAAPVPAPAAAAPAPAPAPAAATAPAAPVSVPAPSALPEIRRKNGIEYITGGIGIDESRAIQFEAEHWPLLITMAEITRGQSRAVWVANVDVSISTRQGKPVIDFRSDGPLALVRLEAGKYTINARFNGIDEKRDFMVMAGMSQKLVILWKSEPR